MGGGTITPDEHKFHVQSSDKSAVFPLRVITHNIRYATKSLFKYERPWEERLPNLARQLYHYTALPFNPANSIICMQEVLKSQLDDINHLLNTKCSLTGDNASEQAWASIGVGRDDGRTKGEYNPIFYRTSAWEKLHYETIWLSETPGKVSRGWDGACNRICTCLVLLSKGPRCAGVQGRKIMILNTHLDHRGLTARHDGAELIIRYANKWRSQFEPDHVVLTGDLNSPKDETGGAWEVLNAEGSGFVDSTRLLEKSNSSSGVSDVRRFGEKVTFTGFNGRGDGDEAGIIDFVHYGLDEGESIQQAQSKLHSYTVVPNVFGNGTRCSDHRAVVVDFCF